MSYNLTNQHCDLNSKVKYILLVATKDMKEKDGKLTLKRKYGKFKREVKKINVNG